MSSRILALGFFVALISPALAQNPPPLITPPQSSQWTANQATKAVSITPTNGKAFAPTRGLFVAGTSGGAACNLNMKLDLDKSAVLWQNVQIGFLPVSAVDIESTSTTCTGILALY